MLPYREPEILSINVDYWEPCESAQSRTLSQVSHIVEVAQYFSDSGMIVQFDSDSVKAKIDGLIEIEFVFRETEKGVEKSLKVFRIDGENRIEEDINYMRHVIFVLQCMSLTISVNYWLTRGQLHSLTTRDVVLWKCVKTVDEGYIDIQGIKYNVGQCFNMVAPMILFVDPSTAIKIDENYRKFDEKSRLMSVMVHAEEVYQASKNINHMEYGAFFVFRGVVTSIYKVERSNGDLIFEIEEGVDFINNSVNGDVLSRMGYESPVDLNGGEDNEGDNK